MILVFIIGLSAALETRGLVFFQIFSYFFNVFYIESIRFYPKDKFMTRIHSHFERM